MTLREDWVRGKLGRNPVGVGEPARDLSQGSRVQQPWAGGTDPPRGKCPNPSRQTEVVGHRHSSSSLQGDWLAFMSPYYAPSCGSLSLRRCNQMKRGSPTNACRATVLRCRCLRRGRANVLHSAVSNYASKTNILSFRFLVSQCERLTFKPFLEYNAVRLKCSTPPSDAKAFPGPHRWAFQGDIS